MINHKDERKAFLDFANDRNNFINTIFMFGASFDGINFLNTLKERKLKYICRLKYDSSLLVDGGDHIMKCVNDSDIRVLKYKIDDNKYNLATDLFDKG